MARRIRGPRRPGHLVHVLAGLPSSLAPGTRIDCAVALDPASTCQPLRAIFLPPVTAEPESLAEALKGSTLEPLRQYLEHARCLEFTIPAEVATALENGATGLWRAWASTPSFPPSRKNGSGPAGSRPARANPPCLDVRRSTSAFGAGDKAPGSPPSWLHTPRADLATARAKDPSLTPADLHHRMNVSAGEVGMERAMPATPG